MQADTVIFDMDGTLIDSMRFLAEGIRAVASRLAGREFTTAEAVDVLGPPDPDVMSLLLGRPITQDEGELYIGHLREKAASFMPPVPGITAALTDLKAAGISLGVYTARGLTVAMTILETLGLDGYFDTIVGGDSVSNHKPDPEGLLLAMDNLGSDPAQTLYVGDTLHDLQTARGAGVPSVLVLWADNPRTALIPEADYHFEDVPEFVSWVLRGERVRSQP